MKVTESITNIPLLVKLFQAFKNEPKHLEIIILIGLVIVGLFMAAFLIFLFS